MVSLLAVPGGRAESSRPEWNGSEYEVGTVQELQWIRNDPDNDYVLTGDIDASETRDWNGGRGFEPIGAHDTYFTGTFDGGFNSIEGLYIDRTTDNIGLFGIIGPGAVVENVGVENLEFVGGEYRVGGLAGRTSGRISNCYSTGSVVGDSYKVGGLVGRMNRGVIRSSYSTCDASARREAVGGLIGDLEGGLVTNCFASGDVSGKTGVGGLVGANYGGDITKCYAYGGVSGTFQVGGLVGQMDDGSVKDSFWDLERSGQGSSSGGTGKTSLEMTEVRTFTDRSWSQGLISPWDFTKDPHDDDGGLDVWGINPENHGGYPFLEWQGDFIHNIPPNRPENLSPSGRVVGTVQELGARASDNDGDWMDVYFWDGSDGSLMESDRVEGDGVASATWSGLSEGGTYSFLVGSRDNKGAWSENSRLQTFTVNTAPEAPENLGPSGSIAATSVELSASSVDADSDELTVWFYDQSDGSLIGSDRIDSGGTANVTWTGLPEGSSSFRAKAGDNWENSGFSEIQSFLVSLDNNPTITQVTPDTTLVDRKVDEPGSGADDEVTVRAKISDRNGWEDVEELRVWVRDNSDSVVVDGERVVENSPLDSWTLEFTYTFDPEDSTSSMGSYDLRFRSRDGTDRIEEFPWTPVFAVDDIFADAEVDDIRLDVVTVRGSAGRFTGAGLEVTEAGVMDDSGGYTEAGSKPFEVTHPLSSGETYQVYSFFSQGALDGKSAARTVEMPLLRTGSATATTAVRSTLNMEYDTGTYGEADLWFEWREEGGSWNSTVKVNMSGSGEFDQDISSLKEGTDYQFRAVMEEEFTERGETRSFTTDHPRVSMRAVTNVDNEGATVGCDVDLRGGGPVELYLQYRIEGSTGWQEDFVRAVENGGPRTHVLSGLAPDSDYEARWGISAPDRYSGTSEFTTLPSTPPKPSPGSMEVELLTGVMAEGEFSPENFFSPGEEVWVLVNLTAENEPVKFSSVSVTWNYTGEDLPIEVEENENGVYRGSFELPGSMSEGTYQVQARAEASGFDEAYGYAELKVEITDEGEPWWTQLVYQVLLVAVIVSLIIGFLVYRIRSAPKVTEI